jgi:predicted nucleotidyltransferase
VQTPDEAQCKRLARRVAIHSGRTAWRSTIACMSGRSSLIEQHRSAIAAAARAHKAESIAVFGSAARGDDTATSDVDFLVEFEPGSSLFDLLHLQDALAALLGCKVDVVSAGALTDRDEHIRREAAQL